MNRKDLIDNMVEKSAVKKADCEKVLTAFQECVGNALESGDSVTLVGFGTFKVIERAERQGRNPANGDAITIQACRVPRFAVGKKLKEQVK